MTAAMGEDRTLWRAPVGFFLPGTPSASEVGMAAVRGRKRPEAVRAMLREAGYAGELINLTGGMKAWQESARE